MPKAGTYTCLLWEVSLGGLICFKATNKILSLSLFVVGCVLVIRDGKLLQLGTVAGARAPSIDF